MLCCAVQSSRDDETTLLEHAEILVREPATLGLRSRAAAIAYVGRSFRQAISLSEDLDDIEVCHEGDFLSPDLVCPQACLWVVAWLHGVDGRGSISELMLAV